MAQPPKSGFTSLHLLSVFLRGLDWSRGLVQFSLCRKISAQTFIAVAYLAFFFDNIYLWSSKKASTSALNLCCTWDNCYWKLVALGHKLTQWAPQKHWDLYKSQRRSQRKELYHRVRAYFSKPAERRRRSGDAIVFCRSFLEFLGLYFGDTGITVPQRVQFSSRMTFCQT